MWYIYCDLCVQLADNRFSGSLPRDLGHCGQLVRLCVSQNSLSGVLPDNLGNLRKARQLSIWGTDIQADSESRYMVPKGAKLFTDDYQDVDFEGNDVASKVRCPPIGKARRYLSG